MLRILVVFLLLVAAPAGALPVTVYVNGAADYGFDPNDVAAAIGAGATEPQVVSGLFANDFFKLTTPVGIPGFKGKNRGNPSRGTSTWTLEVAANTPPGLLDDFVLVILGHDPKDPRKYKTKNVGLEISTLLPWFLVQNGAARNQTYVAYRLGDLTPGGSYEIPIEYRVAQKLKKKKGEFVFPRYSVAYLSVSVPEPSASVLLFAAALGLAARRSR